MNIFSNPALTFVAIFFTVFLIIFVIKAVYININLQKVIKILKTFKKNEIIFRYQELHQLMISNAFIADYWEEFSNNLIFSDKSSQDSLNDSFHFDAAMSNESKIYCTSDANFYFNEETLINRKINHKLISSIPGLLTGMGPLGTFLYIAMGFSGIDFSSEEKTITSITHLLENIEIAAMISILAIGSALSFIIIERIGYYFLCKQPLNNLQIEVNRLFDKISAEKFLIDLIKETKNQNNALNLYIKDMPGYFKSAMDHSMKAHLAPYLENIVFGLNQQKDFLNKNVLDKLIDK